MRVFVAGATGVVGQYLIPGLVAAGHEVTGTTRSPAKAGQLKGAGATPVIVDGLDRRAVLQWLAELMDVRHVSRYRGKGPPCTATYGAQGSDR